MFESSLTDLGYHTVSEPTHEVVAHEHQDRQYGDQSDTGEEHMGKGFFISTHQSIVDGIADTLRECQVERTPYQ
jgi:hypothetical protein